MAKDTLYVEADDEITVVIDKVTTAKNKVVALVLPKRATVFQSVVNMKLLQRAAKESQKNLVLISSEDAIRSIAGVAGLHVASSLNSKPEIPKRAIKAPAETTIAVDDTVAEKPNAVGAAAVAATTAKALADAHEDDVIKMDEEPELPKSASVTDEPIEKSVKKGKFKVPDFTSFKIKLLVGLGVIVLLIGGWVYGFVIAPKAKVIINAETSRTTVGYEFTANAGAAQVDLDNRTLPAKLVEITKENKVTIPTTGEKNKGDKATGTMVVTNCNKEDESISVAVGTVFSAGGLNFVATDAAVVAASNFTGSGICKKDKSVSVHVAASDPGAKYNVSAKTYSTSDSDLSGEGSAMTGGSDNIVKIVSADDLKNAASQLKGNSSAEASADLQKQLSDQNQRPLEQTLEEGTPAQKNSATEGAEATELTVTQTVTYKMLGVSQEDMVKLLDAQIQAQMKKDNVNKNVRNNGLDKVALRLVNKASTEQQIIGVQTVATLGPEFDIESIKTNAAGKKRGDIEKMIEAQDSVRSVDVVYSPAWVTTTPKSAKKITVEVNEVQN